MAHEKSRKKFYGSVTVSERGQVVIPAEARKDFGIEVGEKLLVLGDLDKGLVFTRSNFVLRMLEGSMKTAKHMEAILRGEVTAGEFDEAEGDDE
jgi:AbrB family looped-hinge helix DNA binding protein